MRTRPGAIRWLITVVTAACVSLCCCNVEAMIQIGRTDGAPEGARAGCCAHRGEGRSGMSGRRSPRERRDRDGGCKCADRKVAVAGARAAVAVAAGEIAWTAPDPVGARLVLVGDGGGTAVRGAGRPTAVPARSLLRQHCALVV
jgi:hypothetical protein